MVRPNYPEVVDALARSLRDTSDIVRLAAASALSAEGVDPRAAVSGLHEVLHDSAHADVRESMVLIMGAMGSERAVALLPSLREALADPDARVRSTAVEAIGTLGSVAAGEAQRIARLANDSMAAVRQAVYRALLNLRAPSTLTVPIAVSALSDSAARVRSSAALALGALGRDAAAAVPQLIRALDDEDPSVVRRAVFALSSIGPPARPALPKLKELESRLPGSALEAIAIVDGKRAPTRSDLEPTSQEKCRGVSANPRC